ncbi:hypothetical protein HZA43_05505 [Candidatus Peregrinibacteria bacterium]|nr:hypothetical protein [Candidatus Peregrinibacteria bacterium]
MITQVSFVADKNLKDQALEKARREGITLKAFLVQAMKGYVEGKISLSLDLEPNLMELPVDAIDADLKKQASMAKKSRKTDLIDIQ